MTPPLFCCRLFCSNFPLLPRIRNSTLLPPSVILLVYSWSRWIIDSELIFRERFHYDRERENWILNRFTDLSLITQIHGYLLGVKSIKKLIGSLQKFWFTFFTPPHSQHSSVWLLPVISLLLSNTVLWGRTCLSIWLERFCEKKLEKRGTFIPRWTQ